MQTNTFKCKKKKKKKNLINVYYVCICLFIRRIYRNYTVIMKIIINSVKISSPIGTINNSKVVDSAIIVKLGKYKIICRYGYKVL